VSPRAGDVGSWSPVVIRPKKPSRARPSMSTTSRRSEGAGIDPVAGGMSPNLQPLERACCSFCPRDLTLRPLTHGLCPPRYPALGLPASQRRPGQRMGPFFPCKGGRDDRPRRLRFRAKPSVRRALNPKKKKAAHAAGRPEIAKGKSETCPCRRAESDWRSFKWHPLPPRLALFPGGCNPPPGGVLSRRPPR